MTTDPAQLARFKEEAAFALDLWEKAGKRADRARLAYEKTLGQADNNRYNQALEIYRAQKEFAISMLSRVGKKLTINGVTYRSIPTRREIRVTPVKPTRSKL